MNVNKINNTNFKAIPVADIKIKGLQNQYKLYDITRSDKDYLMKFFNKLDLEKLMPNLKEHEYDTWSGIIQSAIELAANSGRKTILETCNDKPCGFLNYFEFPSKFHLNYIATFPIKENEKTPFAGQILFNEVFRRLIDSMIDVMELNALKKAPFAPISKYSRLGFQPFDSNGFSERMKITRSGIIDTLKKQDKFISYREIVNKDNVSFENKQKTSGFFDRLLLPFIENL